MGPKLAERERVFKAQGIRWWVQSARLRTFIQENGNRLDIHSDKLSCRTASDDNEQYDAKTDLSIQTFVPIEVTRQEQFTVILMAYSPTRNANQLRLLTHFSKIPAVHEVVFVWNSQTDDAPDIAQLGRTLRPIRVVLSAVNSLNNRWNHSLYPKTDGVLMLDDDTFLPLQTVRSLHARWLYDSTRLVGLVGRNFADSDYIYPKSCCDRYEHHAAECDKPAGSRERNVNCSSSTRAGPHNGSDASGGQGSGEWGSMDVFCDTFRFVLPKGMFFHRKYMRLYTSWKRKKMRQYVDEQAAHCDDIGFNLVVQSATGKAGVILEDAFEELPESSAGYGWTFFLTFFLDLFSRVSQLYATPRISRGFIGSVPPNDGARDVVYSTCYPRSSDADRGLQSHGVTTSRLQALQRVIGGEQGGASGGPHRMCTMAGQVLFDVVDVLIPDRIWRL